MSTVRKQRQVPFLYSVVNPIFLASAAFSQNESLVAFGGLIQRVTVTIGWTWLTLLAIHLRNDQSRAGKRLV